MSFEILITAPLQRKNVLLQRFRLAIQVEALVVVIVIIGVFAGEAVRK